MDTLITCGGDRAGCSAPPLVTVILPCRNEEKFIAGCLDSIISSDYPKDRLEVFVVDGMSEDGTRKILDGYTARHNFIMMLENKRKTTPCAFNLGIKNAHGDIIIIMGMHATYDSDYITKCVKYLQEYDADNVGGVMVTVPRDDTLMGKAIAQALSHKFGVGNSMFRTGAKKPVYVDTVFGGCYKKEVFEKYRDVQRETYQKPGYRIELQVEKIRRTHPARAGNQLQILCAVGN